MLEGHSSIQDKSVKKLGQTNILACVDITKATAGKVIFNLVKICCVEDSPGWSSRFVQDILCSKFKFNTSPSSILSKILWGLYLLDNDNDIWIKATQNGWKWTCGKNEWYGIHYSCIELPSWEVCCFSIYLEAHLVSSMEDRFSSETLREKLN